LSERSIGDTPERDVRITDTSLRDGSHAKRHQFTEDDVAAVVSALDAAGVPVVEVTHGDGLGGSSYTYGFSLVDERKLIETAARTARRAKVAVLLLPGIGVRDDIRAAKDAGASIVRVATHCTEADIAVQHFGLARDLGLETVGFLMLSHMAAPEQLAEQARIMVDAGCECVYVVDSAGALILDQASARVAALVDVIGDRAQVGFHGHQNICLGVANSVLAYRAGATQLDGSTRGFGAGAGNSPVEVMAAVFDRLGVNTGIDVLRIVDAAEDVVRPVMDEECVADRLSIVMAYAGVYSSFQKHAAKLAERYGISGAEILVEAGRRKLVGGQEDQLIDIASSLAHVSPEAVLASGGAT
jgi:4-hydroxy 2-oxovalerate aldolase